MIMMLDANGEGCRTPATLNHWCCSQIRWSGKIRSMPSCAAAAAVEVAGRFVGEDDRRAPDEGAGDRHPLPLASGELGGLERRAVGESDPFERLVRAAAPLGGRGAGVEQPIGDVVAHRGVLGQPGAGAEGGDDG
jgi:hypothetical protein